MLTIKKAMAVSAMMFMAKGFSIVKTALMPHLYCRIIHPRFLGSWETNHIKTMPFALIAKGIGIINLRVTGKLIFNSMVANTADLVALRHDNLRIAMLGL